MKKIAALMLLLTSTVLRAETIDYYKWPASLANQDKKNSLQAKVAGLNDPIPEGTANDLYPSDLQLVNAARLLATQIDSVVELHYLPSYWLQKKKEFSYTNNKLSYCSSKLKLNNRVTVLEEEIEYTDDEKLLYLFKQEASNYLTGEMSDTVLLKNDYIDGLLMKSYFKPSKNVCLNPLLMDMGLHYPITKYYSYDEDNFIDTIFAGKSYFNFLYDNEQRLIREIKRPKNNQYDATWHDVIYEYIEGDTRFQLITHVVKYQLLQDEGIFSAYDYSRETYTYQQDDQKRVIAMDYYLEYLLYGNPTPDEQYRINYQYYNDKMVYAEVCINPEPGNDEKWFVQEKINYTYYANGLLKTIHESIFDERNRTWGDYKFRKYYYQGIDLETGLDFSQKDQLSVYPNPVQSTLYIDGCKDVMLKYELLNLQGTLIEKGETSDAFLKVQELQPGTYFLKITNAQSSMLTKFVKLP